MTMAFSTCTQWTAFNLARDALHHCFISYRSHHIPTCEIIGSKSLIELYSCIVHCLISYITHHIPTSSLDRWPREREYIVCQLIYQSSYRSKKVKRNFLSSLYLSEIVTHLALVENIDSKLICVVLFNMIIMFFGVTFWWVSEWMCVG